ncbi:hypothetical protein [Streptomyces sp. NBC_00151]|uniref:hypothetical protein n=1 Tax=Streptomyces sp. NBC_00151 TaxID=2975669 RepID=UPI002DD7E5AA|nr:hypothetical protein [Streptomyces sp. NBC_00151]WRZ44219.1 hypothetical protein OG915_42985 [Streptomyces sp. NBC_00151]
MGTTLTPEFWRQFAVLLVIAAAVVVAAEAALDALVLRMRDRRTSQRPPVPPVESAAREPQTARRTPVHR